MKRTVVWAILVVAVIASAVLLVATKNNADKNKGDDITTGQQADAGGTKRACDVFTLDVAKQVLGDQAKQSDTDGAGHASTDDISVSSCIYEAGSGRDVIIANALVRGAKHKEAYQSNTYGFESAREQGTEPGKKVSSQKINGLGDDAYYNPSTKQVNVLVNNGQYWLILQVGGERAPAEKLGNALVSKL